MSRKAKNPKTSVAMCPVCEKAVIDGGRKSQDSIFCEGSCQAWLHRCCAGLTRTRFAELSDDSMPFYCPSCASDKHTQELAELKSAMAALVQEVEQLKSSVHMLSSTVQPAEGDEQTWSQVVQKKRKPKKPRQAQGADQSAEERARKRTNVSDQRLSGAGERRGSSREQTSPSQKEKVVGARTIWGTLRTTTVATVTSALSRLTSVGDKLQIRRKFKTTTGNRIRWWFVVRGSEEDLCNLENEWDRIKIQTSWKLEVCYKLIENPPPQDQDQASANCESDTANHDSGTDKSILSETTSLQDTTQSCPEHPLATSPQGETPLREEN